MQSYTTETALELYPLLSPTPVDTKFMKGVIMVQ